MKIEKWKEKKDERKKMIKKNIDDKGVPNGGGEYYE